MPRADLRFALLNLIPVALYAGLIVASFANMGGPLPVAWGLGLGLGMGHLRMVKNIDLAVGEGYDLTLKDGSVVEVSRRQARELRERLAL